MVGQLSEKGERPAHIHHLLRFVQIGRPVEELVMYGLTIVHVAQLLQSARNMGLIEYSSERQLVLTAAGRSELSRVVMRDGRLSGGWIEPDESSRTEAIDMYDIYLPSKRTIRRMMEERREN